MQLLWLLILAAPTGSRAPLFLVLAIGELLVPVWAERARGSRRFFHPEHIEERYGLFTIIVLGESILAASVGIRQIATEGVTAGLIVIAIGGLLLAFGAWWLYFDHPGHLTPSPRVAFRWGYIHVVVFASLAALGAGVYTAAEAEAGHTTERTGRSPSPSPMAGFLLGLVLLMLATHHAVSPASIGSKLGGATVIVALGALAPPAFAVAGSAIVVVVLVTWMIVDQFHRQLESISHDSRHDGPRRDHQGPVHPPLRRRARALRGLRADVSRRGDLLDVHRHPQRHRRACSPAR